MISLTSAPFVMKNHVVVQAVSNMMRFAIFWCDPVGLKVVGVWGWWDILLMADNFTPRCVRSWQGLDDSDVHYVIDIRSIKLVRDPIFVPVAAWTWRVPYIATSSGKCGITVPLWWVHPFNRRLWIWVWHVILQDTRITTTIHTTSNLAWKWIPSRLRLAPCVDLAVHQAGTECRALCIGPAQLASMESGHWLWTHINAREATNSVMRAKSIGSKTWHQDQGSGVVT